MLGRTIETKYKELLELLPDFIIIRFNNSPDVEIREGHEIIYKGSINLIWNKLKLNQPWR